MTVRVLLTVHHSLDRNAGAAGATISLAHEFERLGSDAEILSHDALPGRLSEQAKHLLFPFLVWRRLGSAAPPPDVVDSSTGDTWLWASIPRMGAGPLIVVRSHGLEHEAHAQLRDEERRGHLRLSWRYRLYHGGVRLWEVARSLRAADLALFMNSRDREIAIERLGVRAERAAVVRNGIPDTLVGVELEPTPLDQSDPIAIALIGSYIPRKGITYARAALSAVLAGEADVRVTFLGTGTSGADVLADYDPALHDRIRVIPAFERDELPALLRGHHIQLFPSLSEGFSMALVEGMACGLAPVVTATSGALEIVRDAEEGLVVPLRDSRALVAALERLTVDRPLLDRLRHSAHGAVQRLSWRNVARETLDLYAEHLERREVERERSPARAAAARRRAVSRVDTEKRR